VGDGYPTKCYATGEVTSKWSAGGIISYIHSYQQDVSYCFGLNTKITKETGTSTNFGRIAGNNFGAPNNNYALGTMQYFSSPTATGTTTFVNAQTTQNGKDGITITEAQAKQQSTYVNAGWDFTSVWKMPSSGGYPILKWQE